MTTARTIILTAILTLGLPSAQAMAADGWGASWSFGPVHPTTSNHIIYTKTTLVPGRLPVSYWSSSSIGPLFLWPGISNPTSDLIQTTMDAWSGNENSSYCTGNGSQWCVEASVFNGGQINGPTVAIDPDDQVTIEYELGADNNTWTQTVTSQKLGKVVSTLQSKSGLMLGGGFGFATEADADSFTVDTAYYLCTEIHLAAADAAFGATGVGGIGANHGATGTGSGIGTAKNLRTPDGGLTWLVDLITLPAMNPQGTQTPPPTIACGADAGGDTGADVHTDTGNEAAVDSAVDTGVVDTNPVHDSAVDTGVVDSSPPSDSATLASDTALDSAADFDIGTLTEAAATDSTSAQDTLTTTLADTSHVDSAPAVDSASPSNDATTATAPANSGCSCNVNPRSSSNALFLLSLLALARLRRSNRKQSA